MGNRSAASFFLLITTLFFLCAAPPPAAPITFSSGPMQEYLFLEGKKLYDAGKPARAIQAWKNLPPDRVYAPVAAILVARSHRRLGRPDRAEAVLRRFLQKYPTSPYRHIARDALVEALSAQGKPEARGMLTSMLATARNGERPALILRAARLERRLGNFKAASVQYQKLFLHYPASIEGLKAANELARMVFVGKAPPPDFSDEEHLARAERLCRKGRFDLAAYTYKALLKKNPSDRKLALKLARCHYKDRQNRKAIRLLKTLLKGKLQTQDRAEALYLLSLLYWRKDREREFEAACSKIIQSGTPKLKRKALFNLAASHLEKKRLSKAEHYFTKLLALGPSRSTTVDVLWKMAWIHYKEKQYLKAASTFRRARISASSGNMLIAAKYWQGRSLIRCGRTAEGESLLREIAESAPLKYYGAEAARVMKARGRRVSPRNHAGRAFPSLAVSPKLRASNRVVVAERLMKSDVPEFALLQLDALPGSVKSTRAIAFLRAKAAHAAGRYRLARDILAEQFGHLMTNPPANAPKEFVELAFPRVHFNETLQAATKHAVDPYLVWSVIRQESLYDASAVSPAGALGLMQVMPRSTGLVRKGRPVPAKVIARILDPAENLAFGIRILARNLQAFKGRLVPAIASYNADIRKVRQWVRQNGNLKQDEFIESIHLETRLYVKKVLANYRAYTYLHRRKDLAGYW
ncbi:MAG: transglycosylase SLT domain-containing protein [Deltaproteobacteria bacterium]